MSCLAKRLDGKTGSFFWSVTHDCEKGKHNLDIKGDAPPSLKDIHARLTSEQNAEDEDVDHVYDAPVELAKTITGFRHDQGMPGMRETPFQVLKKMTLFSRLFGE